MWSQLIKFQTLRVEFITWRYTLNTLSFLYFFFYYSSECVEWQSRFTCSTADRFDRLDFVFKTQTVRAWNNQPRVNLSRIPCAISLRPAAKIRYEERTGSRRRTRKRTQCIFAWLRGISSRFMITVCIWVGQSVFRPASRNPGLSFAPVLSSASRIGLEIRSAGPSATSNWKFEIDQCRLRRPPLEFRMEEFPLEFLPTAICCFCWDHFACDRAIV